MARAPGIVDRGRRGILVVIAKHIVVFFMSVLYSPWLAVAGGLAVGAPEMFRAAGRRITGTKRR